MSKSDPDSNIGLQTDQWHAVLLWQDSFSGLCSELLRMIDLLDRVVDKANRPSELLPECHLLVNVKQVAPLEGDKDPYRHRRQDECRLKV